ncbi:MAG: hypothetical protein K0U72_04905 [Gammaproteobacteria bacterium]|nr:hypothetical protein [Gammaproteobacteria bacterium]
MKKIVSCDKIRIVKGKAKFQFKFVDGQTENYETKFDNLVTLTNALHASYDPSQLGLTDRSFDTYSIHKGDESGTILLQLTSPRSTKIQHFYLTEDLAMKLGYALITSVGSSV